MVNFTLFQRSFQHISQYLLDTLNIMQYEEPVSRAGVTSQKDTLGKGGAASKCNEACWWISAVRRVSLKTSNSALFAKMCSRTGWLFAFHSFPSYTWLMGVYHDTLSWTGLAPFLHRFFRRSLLGYLFSSHIFLVVPRPLLWLPLVLQKVTSEASNRDDDQLSPGQHDTHTKTTQFCPYCCLITQ